MAPRARNPTRLYVDAGRLAADAESLDALARLALVARRHGCEVRLAHASAQLLGLIELAGLTEVLPAEPLSPRSREPRC